MPKCESYSDKAVIWLLLALVYYKDGKMAEAQRYIDLAVGIRPYFGSALILQKEIMEVRFT